MMITTSLLAKKYATAFLNCYQKELTAQDYENFAVAADQLQHNKSLIFLLKISYIGSAQNKNFFLEHLIARYHLPQATTFLVKTLMKRQRLFLLKEIFKAIVDLYKRDHNILPITIESSQALTQEQITMLRTILAQKTGCHIVATICVNSNLIAGIRITGETILWEHSVAQQLRQARQLVTQ